MAEEEKKEPTIEEQMKDVIGRVEKLEEKPEPEEPPYEPKPLKDIESSDIFKVFKLYITHVYDDTSATKTELGFLTLNQKTDLTDGGATTLHSHTHASTHQNGGADEINVGGLSGELADNQPPKSHALNSHSNPTGDISMNSNKITNVTDPATDQDAATKKYVDDTAGLPTEWKLSAFAADLRASADTERDTTSDSYVKLKEIVMLGDGGLRVKFELKNHGGTNTAVARVYVNGGAVSDEFTEELDGYNTHQCDVSGLVHGDLIQLYAHRIANGHAYVRNFRVYGTPNSDWTINTD